MPISFKQRMKAQFGRQKIQNEKNKYGRSVAIGRDAIADPAMGGIAIGNNAQAFGPPAFTGFNYPENPGDYTIGQITIQDSTGAPIEPGVPVEIPPFTGPVGFPLIENPDYGVSVDDIVGAQPMVPQPGGILLGNGDPIPDFMEWSYVNEPADQHFQQIIDQFGQPTLPKEGTIVWNTVLECLQIFEEGEWVSIMSAETVRAMRKDRLAAKQKPKLNRFQQVLKEMNGNVAEAKEKQENTQRDLCEAAEDILADICRQLIEFEKKQKDEHWY